MKNKILLFIFLFFILLTWFSASVPFFWDGTFFSKISLVFYENGYNNLIVPEILDPGGFPMYSIYLSFAWTLFGKSLWVSHLALLPFLLMIGHEYFKLSRYFLKEQYVPFAMLLLIIEPCFLTQSILMGYDLLMILFFLAALNALLNKKDILFSVLLVLLCMSSVRGMLLASSLFLIDVYLNKFNRNSIKKYLLAPIVLIGWMVYHNYQTGWYLINPIKENTHQAFVFGSIVLKQFVYIVWKINDFGRVVLWLIAFGGIVMLFKNKQYAVKPLLSVLIIPLCVLIGGMIFIGNPIGHRYFIVIFLILNILFCYVLQEMKNRKTAYAIYFLSVLSLLTGNFWMYPPKYGNGWDSSLKVMPVFSLKKQMDDFIKQQNIAPEEVGTQFPFIANEQEMYLTENDFQYQNVWSGPLSDFNYFLHSNVINTDIPEQFNEAITSWKLLKQLRSGQVEISLYENPAFISNPHSH